jgi:hypothetical protein
MADGIFPHCTYQHPELPPQTFPPPPPHSSPSRSLGTQVCIGFDKYEGKINRNKIDWKSDKRRKKIP